MNTMQQYIKKSIVVIGLLLVSITYAQQGINYQGVARNAANELLIDTDITLDLNIVKTSTDGEITYSETHTTSTDANGVFSIIIGNGASTLNLFEDINWAENKHFLNVFLNGTEIGTTAFTSVPYSQALGKWQAHKNGVTPKGTGMSIYIGDNAGENDDFTDNQNIGIGKDALQRTNNGYDNIAIGEEAMKLLTDGHGNTAIGKQALFNTSSGSANIAIGNQALYNNSNGARNIAIGGNALQSNTTGGSNISIGDGSLNANTTGQENIALGTLALNNNISGYSNIANGLFSLALNTEGSNNIAHGALSMYYNTTGNNNVANGFNALLSNTTGDDNIANGYEALLNNTEGNNNIANGLQALKSNTTGSGNLAYGMHALLFNTTGYYNVAIGHRALTSNDIGSENVAVGYHAGGRAKGDGNVFLGNQAGFNELGSNKLYVNNTDSTFPLIYGEFDNETLGFNAKVGIGTKNPEAPLQVYSGSDVTLSDGAGFFLVGRQSAKNIIFDNNEIQARENGVASTLYIQGEGGTLDIGGQVLVDGSVVHASDKRLKRDIADLSYGLKEVLKLRPTEYFWKGKTQSHKSLGLIAQEVDEVIKNVVTYDKEQDKYGVSYTELIPVLIKAIQEQQHIIEIQQNKNDNQSKELSTLEARIEIIETALIQANNGAN